MPLNMIGQFSINKDNKGKGGTTQSPLGTLIVALAVVLVVATV